MAATRHFNLQLIASPNVQNMWAIVDGNLVLIERGRTVRAVAGENASARELCYLAENAPTPAVPLAWRATNADRPLLGFFTEDVLAGEETYVQIDGTVEDTDVTPTWNWTPGAPLYADGSPTPTPGALTETQYGPPVAQALSATEILIFPGGLNAPS